MYCPSCGTTTEGKFCEKCGAATGANAPPVASAPGLQMNIVAAICYLIPVICPIIFLVIDPYKRDKRVRFAAFQSLFLSLALFLVNSVLGILFSGSMGLYRIVQLINLAELILLCFLAFKAFQNEKYVLPGIGPIAEKQA